MSTAENGDRQLVSTIVAGAKAQIAEAAADVEQFELLDPISPEEMAAAREDLGELAGRLTVLRHAREKRRGRPPGARNKRTDDFARYILSFGPHPAIGMMQTQGASPEALIEASRRTVKKLVKGGGDKPDQIVEFVEEMSYGEAMGLRLRAAEGLLPYIESKKVSIDATVRSDFTLIEEAPRDGVPIDAQDAEFIDIQAQPPGGDDGGSR